MATKVPWWLGGDRYWLQLRSTLGLGLCRVNLFLIANTAVKLYLRCQLKIRSEFRADPHQCSAWARITDARPQYRASNVRQGSG